MQTIERPFPGQRRDERVILFVRKHWVSFLGFIGLTIGMIIIPIVLIIILGFLLPDLLNAFISPIILIISAYSLFVLAFFLVGWIDYYFDIVIVTNRRIVDIHQRGLFHRDIDELDLFHIEDVSAKIKGVLPTLFHYGTVFVQTAGTARNFEFESVPYPQRMSRQIMTLYDEVVSKKPARRKAIDQLEGLGERQPHPSGERIEKEFEKDIRETGEPRVGEKIPHNSQSVQSPDQQREIEKPIPPKTEYQKLIEKDRQKNPENKDHLDGEISNGDQVDLSDGPRKY